MSSRSIWSASITTRACIRHWAIAAQKSARRWPVSLNPGVRYFRATSRRSLIGTSGLEEGPDADEVDFAGSAKCQFARPAGFY